MLNFKAQGIRSSVDESRSMIKLFFTFPGARKSADQAFNRTAMAAFRQRV